MTGATIDDAALADAHHRMVTSGRVQLDLPVFEPPQLPDWLRPLFEALARAGPLVEYGFWTGVALVLLWALWRLARWLIPLLRQWRRDAADAAPAEQWAPELAPTRALLVEADGLAAAGAYAEAVHLLLLRSVEQIEARFPGQLRQSWTSRDIARAAILPPAMAAAFGAIAAVVEAGLFGRQPVGEAAWRQCREAYAGAVARRAT